jgi:hypothetical protein
MARTNPMHAARRRRKRRKDVGICLACFSCQAACRISCSVVRGILTFLLFSGNILKCHKQTAEYLERIFCMEDKHEREMKISVRKKRPELLTAFLLDMQMLWDVTSYQWVCGYRLLYPCIRRHHDPSKRREELTRRHSITR